MNITVYDQAIQEWMASDPVNFVHLNDSYLNQRGYLKLIEHSFLYAWVFYYECPQVSGMMWTKHYAGTGLEIVTNMIANATNIVLYSNSCD